MRYFLIFLLVASESINAKSYDFIYSKVNDGVYGYSYANKISYKITKKHKRYYNISLLNNGNILFDDNSDIYIYDVNNKIRNLKVKRANCPVYYSSSIYYIDRESRWFSKLDTENDETINFANRLPHTCPVLVGNKIIFYEKLSGQMSIYDTLKKSFIGIKMNYSIPMFSIGKRVLVWEDSNYFIYDLEFKNKEEVNFGACGVPVLYDKKNEKLIYSIESTCVNWLVGFISDGLYSYSIKNGEKEHLVKDVFVKEGNGSS